VNELGRYDTTTVLEKALPVIEASHRILANNIANANTPGFEPAHVSFRESLQRALSGTAASTSLKVTHRRHIPSGDVQSGLVLESDTFEPGRNDKSTFDVDREMVELLKNTSRFETISSILTKRYQQMREVLRMS
jgi:flagellar basal-body rod protein FlgB